MLCFSDRHPGDWGPRRVTQAEIRASFATGWNVLSIEESRFDPATGADQVVGWLSAIART
jgi:hypothetical protein